MTKIRKTIPKGRLSFMQGGSIRHRFITIEPKTGLAIFCVDTELNDGKRRYSDPYNIEPKDFVRSFKTAAQDMNRSLAERDSLQQTNQKMQNALLRVPQAREPNSQRKTVRAKASKAPAP